MSKNLTITSIEQELDMLADRLLSAGTMRIWSSLISRYHALHIKLARMRGEGVLVDYTKSDYII